MGRARKEGGKASALKKLTAERVRKPNPFDLVYKKTKAQVVAGAKPVAFAKRQAFDNRQQTIGVEYRNHGKANKIVDKRLAERDASVSAFEKAERRFILQRKLLFSKNRSSRFNLDDDDREGETAAAADNVANGEKFNTRKRIYRDDGDGELDSELVALANFGGGRFDEDKRAENLFVRPATREDALTNLIAASKQAKAVRQMERDTQADNTDRLNELFDRLKNTGALQLKNTARSAAAPTIVGRPVTAAANGDVAQFESKPLVMTPAVENPVPVVESKAPKAADYDSLYRDLMSDDSGRRAVAAAMKPLVDAGAPVDLEESVTELECISATPTTADVVKRVAELTERIYKHAKVRPLAVAERLLTCVIASRQRHVHDAASVADFGGINFECAVLVRVVGSVFVTCDRFHAVATPTLAFAAEAVACSRVRSAQHAAQLLFFCDTLADWVATSRRYLPEVVAFLRGCLLLSVANEENEKFPSFSFPITSPFRQMLYVESKINAEPDVISIVKLFAPTSDAMSTKSAADKSPEPKCRRRSSKAAAVLANTQPAEWSWNDSVARLTTIRALLAVVRRFAELYASHTMSYYAIFKPIWELLKRLPMENYPPKIADDAKRLIDFVEAKLAAAPHLTHLKLTDRTTFRPVEMLEPRFDDNFDATCVDFGAAVGNDAARKARKREQQMRQRLRKETRGAMKELRADAKYIAKLQHERAQAVSKDRREKTKHILASLQTQESEYKKRKLKKY